MDLPSSITDQKAENELIFYTANCIPADSDDLNPNPNLKPELKTKTKGDSSSKLCCIICLTCTICPCLYGWRCVECFIGPKNSQHCCNCMFRTGYNCYSNCCNKQNKDKEKEKDKNGEKEKSKKKERSKEELDLDAEFEMKMKVQEDFMKKYYEERKLKREMYLKAQHKKQKQEQQYHMNNFMEFMIPPDFTLNYDHDFEGKEKEKENEDIIVFL